MCCMATVGFSVTRNEPPTGKPAYSLASGMPDFCSSFSAPPPAPMNRNLASVADSVPSFRFLYSTCQEPSLLRVMSCTSLDSFSSKPFWVCRWPTNWRVISPKLTSVPIGVQVTASFWFGSRPSIISGTHLAICAWSSEYCIGRNSGLACSAS
ncbi:hypothetical protein D3C76_1392000 [compost metagenome]